MTEKSLRKTAEDLLRLKRTLRTGWDYYGYGPPETVAAHTFGVAVLTLLLGRWLRQRGQPVNLERALAMALLHEAGEARIGDLHLEARRWIGPAVEEGERAAAREVLQDQGLVALYQEFEAGETREARLVRAADKLELLLEARERARTPWEVVRTIFQTPVTREALAGFPELQAWLEDLERELGEES